MGSFQAPRHGGLVFGNGFAQIAEMPVLYGGYRTSSAHARAKGIAPNLAMLRHSKPHGAPYGGIAEIGPVLQSREHPSITLC